VSDEAEQFLVPRMPGGKIDMDMRERILAAYLDGKNQSDIAEEFKVSKSAVRGIIRSDERVSLVKNNKIEYNVVNRLKVLDKAFFQVESMIERCSDEFRMKNLVDSLNVLIHTRRIEEGLTGASVASMKAFTMNVTIQDAVKKLAEEDDLPELSAGDSTIDVNPVEEAQIEEPAAPTDDFT